VKKLLFILFVFLSNFSQGQDTTLIYNDSTYIYRSLQEASANPDRVFRLNLSRKRLDSIPAEVFQFKNLTELDLSRNRITELPKEIGSLSNLQRLNLGNNNLVNLPDEIGSLKNLVYLGLNRNKIESLPPTIGQLQNLEVLELWDNELADVPDEIAELQNLRVLELRGILFTPEQQQRIDSLVVKSAKLYLSPSCNCKN